MKTICGYCGHQKLSNYDFYCNKAEIEGKGIRHPTCIHDEELKDYFDGENNSDAIEIKKLTNQLNALHDEYNKLEKELEVIKKYLNIIDKEKLKKEIL